MPFHIKINEKLTCPQRHRYNPERHSLGFHAGCTACHGMYAVWLRVEALKDAIRHARAAARLATDYRHEEELAREVPTSPTCITGD